MSLSFKRRVGASADVKELEYIIALHQTCMPDTRDNATVSSIDVLRFLKSRYGLNVTHAKAIEIVRGLGGSDVVAANVTENTKKNFMPFFHKKKTGQSDLGETDESKAKIDESEAQDNDKPVRHSWDIPLLNKKASKGASKPSGNEVGDSTLPAEEAGEDEDAQPRMVKVDPGVSDIENSSKIETEEVCASSSAVQEENIYVSKDGSGADFPEQYIDLVQILSILLIPAVARAADEFKNGPRERPILPEPTGHWLFHPIRRAVWKLLQHVADKMHSHYEGMRPLPERSLARDILNILLRDIRECQIDEDLIQSLLLQCGEVERANNPQLIREMVEAAQSSSGCLDEEAFFNALTGDLQELDVDSDYQFSTFFEDVFGTDDPNKVTHIEAEDPVDHENDEEDPIGSSAEAKKITESIDAGTDVAKKSSSRPGIRKGDPDLEGQTCFCCRYGTGTWVSKLFSRCCFCYFKLSKGPFTTSNFDIDLVLDSHLSLLTIVVLWIFFVAR